MPISRRHVLAGLVAAPAALSFPSRLLAASTATTLKISHQFPGGSIDKGDFRDRLCRIFARDVEQRTNGALRFEVYAGASLMKTNAQFSALRKGALDLTLYPLAYAGGEVRACNVGLMPCLVTSYEQGARWKTAPIGRALSDALEAKGVKIISWIWQAGGIASRGQPIQVPAQAKGLRIRGGSRDMDLMFAAAGAKVSMMPSNEIYIGMQTGSLDAAVTSSTSLVSFRLAELASGFTAARQGSFWFMFEPLLMSKSIFDILPKDQQQTILDVGAAMEPWGTEEARKDDDQAAKIYGEKAKVVDLSADDLSKWRAVAETSAWANYASQSTETAALLALAKEVA